MKLLSAAIATQRWDLAAHVLVLASALVLKNGHKPLDTAKKKVPSKRQT